MKKLLVSAFAMSAMLLTPALRAEDTSVGQASSEGANAGKSKTWQNVGIAAGALAIAVTALVLVAGGGGGHHHHHHHGHSHD